MCINVIWYIQSIESIVDFVEIDVGGGYEINHKAFNIVTVSQYKLISHFQIIFNTDYQKNWQQNDTTYIY